MASTNQKSSFPSDYKCMHQLGLQNKSCVSSITLFQLKCYLLKFTCNNILSRYHLFSASNLRKQGFGGLEPLHHFLRFTLKLDYAPRNSFDGLYNDITSESHSACLGCFIQTKLLQKWLCQQSISWYCFQCYRCSRRPAVHVDRSVQWDMIVIKT